jgi:hypothetical protein
LLLATSAKIRKEEKTEIKAKKNKSRKICYFTEGLFDCRDYVVLTQVSRLKPNDRGGTAADHPLISGKKY